MEPADAADFHRFPACREEHSQKAHGLENAGKPNYSHNFSVDVFFHPWQREEGTSMQDKTDLSGFSVEASDGSIGKVDKHAGDAGYHEQVSGYYADSRIRTARQRTGPVTR
jgi:hypothetical protein